MKDLLRKHLFSYRSWNLMAFSYFNNFLCFAITDYPSEYRRMQGLLPGRFSEIRLGIDGGAEEDFRDSVNSYCINFLIDYLLLITFWGNVTTFLWSFEILKQFEQNLDCKQWIKFWKICYKICFLLPIRKSSPQTQKSSNLISNSNQSHTSKIWLTSCIVLQVLSRVFLSGSSWCFLFFFV